jgi:hypothetical protein
VPRAVLDCASMSDGGTAGRGKRAFGAALCLAVLVLPNLAQAQDPTTTAPVTTVPPPTEEPTSPDLQLTRPSMLAEPEQPEVGLVGGAAPFQRKHATASFAVGAVGIGGFGAGFAGTFAWELTERYGVELALGVGGMQERGGGAVGGWYADFGAMVPITFKVCASVPRVCPALDFEITIFPGLAYAYLDGSHAGNVILGFGVSSLRKTQSLDVGVRASILAYLDVVGAAVDASADRLLGLVQLQLGCIVRWGVAQP